MADTGTLARPYAVAAYKQAQEEGKVSDWSEMLSLLVTVVRDPMMAGLIASPKAQRTELADLIVDVGGDALSPTGQNFVRVLAENRRLGLLPSVAEIFERERASDEGRTEVEVLTAFELSPAQESAIVVAMTKRLGTRVDLSVTLDDSLIGGVVVRAGDLVMDASLRGRLKHLVQAVT